MNEMRLRHFALLVFFLLGLMPPSVHALENEYACDIHVASDSETTPLGHSIWLLEDSEAVYDLPQLVGKSGAEDWRRNPDDMLRLGLTKASFWGRLTICNESDQAYSRVIDFGNRLIDYLDVYVGVAGGGFQSWFMGDRRPLLPSRYKSPAYNLEIDLGPNQSRTLWFRFASYDGLYAPFTIRIWQPEDYIAHVRLMWLFFGIYCGILFAMLLSNLFVFGFVRDRTYLFYVLYLSSLVIWSGCLVGLSARWLSPSTSNLLFPISTTMVLFSVVHFSLGFLALEKRLDKLKPTLQLLSALLVAPLVAALSGAYAVSMMLSMILLWIILPTLLYAGWSAYRAGYMPARYYLLAFPLPMLAALLYSLSNSILVPEALTSATLFQGASALEAIVLSLGLADRLSRSRFERMKVETNANALKAFLPEKVVSLVVADAQAALMPIRRGVTVLVVRVNGLTDFSKHPDPGSIIRFIEAVYGAFSEIVERHEGMVEHFSGDNMLCIFNAPNEILQPQNCALQCALHMSEAFAQLQADFPDKYEYGLQIGVDHGYATLGATGYSTRRQYGATGLVCNLAFRLAQKANAGQVLVTERVLDAAGREGFKAESLGKHAIRGASTELSLFDLHASHGAAL